MADKNKILIVEDDPFLVKIIDNRLKEEGFEIEVAANGKQALEKMKSQPYAMVLLDLVMPIKTGFEVLEVLKKQGNNTPVLVFTNLAQEEDKKEVMSLGAKAYYIKSDISIDDLVQTILSYQNA